MIRRFGLRTKLLGAFILVGLIVLGISYIGWQSNSRLASTVTSVDDDLEKLIGMGKVNDGLTGATAAERMLLNPQLTREQRQQERTGLSASMTQIEEGLRHYEALPRPGEEDKLTQVAPYKSLKLWAKTNRKTFNAKPAAVTAWMVLGNMLSITRPTVSILLRWSCCTDVIDGGTALVECFFRTGERGMAAASTHPSSLAESL
jgi:hypothetical protein